ASTAALFLLSALVLSRIRTDSRGEARIDLESIPREAFAGFRAILRESRLRMVVGLYGAQTLVAGILRVLLVVTALRVLGLGASAVGFLSSATGVGALVGVLALLGVISSGPLAGAFAAGILLWGVPLIVLGAAPSAVAAVICFGIIGVGNTLVDVAGLTLLQRTAPDEVRARVFGVLESVFLGTIGIGAILAPALTSAFGPRGALIAAGTALTTIVLIFWSRLRTVDAPAPVPEAELELLRGVPIFAPLPPGVLQQVAASLSNLRFRAGHTVFREGDHGDSFYVVAEGEVMVAPAGRPVVTVVPGDSFGEIALLRDVPRTATVIARTDAELLVLERDVFI